jgi:hypothetical protein
VDIGELGFEVHLEILESECPTLESQSMHLRKQQIRGIPPLHNRVKDLLIYPINCVPSYMFSSIVTYYDTVAPPDSAIEYHAEPSHKQITDSPLPSRTIWFEDAEDEPQLVTVMLASAAASPGSVVMIIIFN